jgi:hypothetical protein
MSLIEKPTTNYLVLAMLSHLPKKEQNLLPEISVWANTAEESKEAP